MRVIGRVVGFAMEGWWVLGWFMRAMERGGGLVYEGNGEGWWAGL